MHIIKHEKPPTFYERFDRKGDEQNPDVSHYCPGCGHGVVHNLVAEAIKDFGIQDRVILCSPVGCSVFAYYYFDVGNVQCSHGRAPAAASAIRRSRSDAIVISYQGDGDLAGIGLSHIMHAANRGENITVFFINNGIYGMTGGQMAPTTPLGMRTPTSPLGRDAHNDGLPLEHGRDHQHLARAGVRGARFPLPTRKRSSAPAGPSARRSNARLRARDFPSLKSSRPVPSVGK